MGSGGWAGLGMVGLDAPGEKIWLLLWQTTALTLFIIVLTSLPWFRRPKIASALWLLVIVKTLIPPIFPSLPVPGVRLTDIHAPRLISMPGRSHVLVEDWPSLPRENAPPPPLGPRFQFSVRYTAAEVTAVFLIWLAGGLAVATTGLLRFTQARRLQHRARPLSEPLSTSLAPLLAAFGAQGRVRLLAMDDAVSPQLVGLMRPVILLPVAILEDQEAVHTAVAHELAHWRRKDLWLSVVQCVSLSLWWFHPLIWLASRRLSQAREICADALAIQVLGCSGVEYAHNLMNILTQLTAAEPAAEHRSLAAPTTAPQPDLPAFRSRISSALNSRHPTHPVPTVAAGCVWICLALAVLPGSDWRYSASVLRVVLLGNRAQQCFVSQGPFEYLDPESGRRTYFEMLLPVHHLYNVTWYEAQSLAETRRHEGRPGRLAVVDSRAKHQFLEARFGPSLTHAAPPLYVADNLWIGLTRNHPDRQFRWIDGRAMAHAFWHPSEPNNSNSEELWVHYWIRDEQFSWNDAASDDARRRGDRFGFIVEY
ncbi:MAG: M56 family metallopeptidase [Pirellulales bacterium]